MTQGPAQLFAKYIPPELESLVVELRLPRGPQSRRLQSGEHLAPRRGKSAEFFEHRPYQAGHALRRIDWRATAKSSQAMVRFGEEQLDAPLYLFLDSHAGMSYQRAPWPNRWDWAKALLATLAMTALRQGDPVALFAAPNQLNAQASPSRRLVKLQAMLDQIPSSPQAPNSQLWELLSRWESSQAIPGRVFLLSDWLDLSSAQRSHEQECQTLFDGLARLADQGHEIRALELLHRDELDFPPTQNEEEALCFVDPRGRSPSRVGSSAQLRQEYLQALAEHRDTLRNKAQAARVQWLPMRIDQDWAAQLRTGLLQPSRVS